MTTPNWRNRTLWTGDNLDIMRGMNSERVDQIYLDPPFNSNRNCAAPIGSEAAGAALGYLDPQRRGRSLARRDCRPRAFKPLALERGLDEGGLPPPSPSSAPSWSRPTSQRAGGVPTAKFNIYFLQYEYGA